MRLKRWTVILNKMVDKRETLKLFGEAVADKMNFTPLFKDDFKREEASFDREKFDSILQGTPLENHTETLWKLGLAVRVALQDDSDFKMEASKSNECMIELTKVLLFLMENANKNNIKLSVPRTDIDITNKQSINLIIRCLLPLFKDDEQTEHINIEYLKSKLEYLETYQTAITDKGKKGTPLRTYHIAYVLQRILPLLSNKTSNKNFGLIHEYCEFFKLINEQNTSNFQQIKSTYKSYSGLMPQI